jgi:alpha-amylase/alpha-mannosidase (GH57 family)
MSEAAAPGTLDFVLLWHMHQPDYRDPESGEFCMPWVYLHAIKDYADMAGHLERCPGMRAVVNFAPVLLDQIEDYADQFATGHWRDPLLRLLGRPDGTPFTDDERALVLGQCFNANHRQLIAPYGAYERLHELAYAGEGDGRDALGYLSERYLLDLLVWYHLAWTGETVRRAAPLVTELMTIGSAFTHAQRLALRDLIGTLVATIIPRYRRLAEAGQVELSATPHWHPLAPLLLDFESAREARPELPLPRAAGYPGGAERVAFQWRTAVASHARRFGIPPTGMWPAEGGVSDALVRAVTGSGIAWLASGEKVLEHSLKAAGRPVADRDDWLYRPYRLSMHSEQQAIAGFFRDDRLSDLIGFEYRNWDGGHAATHFVGELEAILARATRGERRTVSVMVDGENAWEYYPFNAYYFLSSLYDQLAAHPRIRPTTFRDDLTAHARERATRTAASGIGELPVVVAGSWVYGDFTTWIGSPDKNAAWDLLAAAKQAADDVLGSGRLSDADRDAVLCRLAVCEASDWFWWFGDYNPATSVERFDRLYRANLAHVYRLLHLPAPLALQAPISRGAAAARSEGAIRRAS